MNLNPLFTKQKQLDDCINKEKGLQGQDLLDKKILALQVELGELANEWRGFKFWSEDQEPRYETVEIYIHGYDGPGTNTRASIEEYQAQPLLEEYVDCLHFILSIGNDLGVTIEEIEGGKIRSLSITKTFIEMYIGAGVLMYKYQPVKSNYCTLVRQLIDLGQQLGFTWEQIEAAYYEKNEINHARQENGY